MLMSCITSRVDHVGPRNSYNAGTDHHVCFFPPTRHMPRSSLFARTKREKKKEPWSVWAMSRTEGEQPHPARVKPTL